jgi:glycerate 2-kinase
VTWETPRVRVLICPDKFAGTLSAVAVADAIAAGWAQARPADEVICRPLADGGPGFLDVVARARGGRRIPVPTSDPLGRPVPGEVLVVDGRAYLECAQACGLHLLTADEKDPKATTSYGLGVLVAAAVETGVREIVVGLGGTAVNDAGAGMLAALGAPPLDVAGCALPYGGAALLAVERLGGQPRIRGVRLIAATDVDAVLTGVRGASSVFGPQKGASREDVFLLDAALERFAGVLQQLPTCPPMVAARPGAGAAGGIGAALLALGGEVVSGIHLVRQLTRLDVVLDEVDLVITGEGSFDAQSLQGKVVAGVAEAARDRGLPCLVVAGRASAGRREAAARGVTETYTLVAHFGDLEQAMTKPAEGLSALAKRLAGQWSRG